MKNDGGEQWLGTLQVEVYLVLWSHKLSIPAPWGAAAHDDDVDHRG